VIKAVASVILNPPKSEKTYPQFCVDARESSSIRVRFFLCIQGAVVLMFLKSGNKMCVQCESFAQDQK